MFYKTNSSYPSYSSYSSYLSYLSYSTYSSYFSGNFFSSPARLWHNNFTEQHLPCFTCLKCLPCSTRLTRLTCLTRLTRLICLTYLIQSYLSYLSYFPDNFFLVQLGCGTTTSQNNTYLVQGTAAVVQPNPCVYTICSSSNSVTRIRFDFTVRLG